LAARSGQVWIGEKLLHVDMEWMEGLPMESVSIPNWWAPLVLGSIVNLSLHIKDMKNDII